MISKLLLYIKYINKNLFIINSEKSFKDIDLWLKDLKSNSSPDIKIFLIGNKSDLEELREIDKETAEKYKKEYGLDYFIETSAKTGMNVQEIFIHAARELYKEYNEYKKEKKKKEELGHTKLNENNAKIQNKKGCC